jgi:hypothetical protein
MRSMRIALVTVAAALGLSAQGAAASAAASSTDSTCQAASPQAAVCIGIDKLANAAATECRALTLPQSECVLPLGQKVLSSARDAYLRSWTHRAIAFQYRLGNSLPLHRAQWLGTHNSFNSFSDGVTLSHMDSNQQLSLSQQLDIDIRALELDTHWLPRANAEGGTVVICHGLDYSQANGGCTTEPPLAAVLPELRAWLAAHPAQVILLYLDNNFGPPQAYAETVHDLNSELRRADGSSMIYRPAPSQITRRGCADLPLSISRDQIRRRGAQVLVVANCRSGWASDVFAWDRNHVESGSTPAFKPFPACDATYSRQVYETNLIRYYEDSTFLSAATGGSETPAEYEANSLTPAKVRAMIGCGVNLLGFDQILPDDGRLEAAVWSWAPGEPDGPAGGSCTIQRLDGRWVDVGCGARRPAACRVPGGGWRLSKPVKWKGAVVACRKRRARFYLPRTGLENARLHAMLRGQPAWLRYRGSRNP